MNAARARLQTYCSSCPYFGYCPGRYAAEATPEQRRLLAVHGCPVRELVAHMVKRIERTATIEKLLSREFGTQRYSRRLQSAREHTRDHQNRSS